MPRCCMSFGTSKTSQSFRIIFVGIAYCKEKTADFILIRTPALRNLNFYFKIIWNPVFSRNLLWLCLNCARTNCHNIWAKQIKRRKWWSLSNLSILITFSLPFIIDCPWLTGQFSWKIRLCCVATARQIPKKIIWPNCVWVCVSGK